MNRRTFLYTTSAALAAWPLRSAWAFQGQPAPTPKFETIRRNVGYFTMRGGTIGWLIGPDAVVIVDTQYADTAKTCLSGVQERAKGRAIDVVFNTHHHGDHTSGNGVFKDAAKKIVAHAKVPELQKRAASQAPPNAASPAPEPVVANATFETTWSEQLGDERVSAKHYGPGHTGGDAVLQFEKAQVVHMGDLFFHELHPRIDRASGASIQNWIKTINSVAKEMPGDTIYIAGHARPGAPVTTGRKELLRQRDYFDALLTHVRGAIAKGMSKDETMKLATLPGFETHAASGNVLTLSAALGVAFDELSATTR
jgi:glyoxylase-like metal-dependent hydrolase (beta-lactamase superfamily II)